MFTQGLPPNPVHLVRALLRECTYLPDPAARAYLQPYIIARFREHWPSKPGDFSSGVLPTGSRQRDLLKRARKGLSTLSRANNGHPHALEKVLAYTYGRSGKRRHELMRFLREADNLDNHEAVTRSATTSIENAPQVPALTSRMEALVKVQMLQKEVVLSKPSIKYLAPQIPKTNSWGRPMPLKRVRNMEKRWYADLLDKVLPPLPTHEWQRLRDLAQGKTRWSGPVPRRRSSLRAVNEPTSLIQHRLTARYMRRLWAKVFARCPVMTLNTSNSKWHVQWGSISGPRNILTAKLSNEDDSIFFQGVTDKGSLVKGSVSH